jgi:serine/threonine protein kinase
MGWPPVGVATGQVQSVESDPDNKASVEVRRWETEIMGQMKAGTHIGPYELIAPIGAGGMGEVWKARDTRLDRMVAIKFSNAAYSDRFEREARAVAALNHPKIAQIYDLGENYIVMEFVDGEPVRAPDSTRKLLDIAVQIADGLAAAHAGGFVHRDLRPDNVLMKIGESEASGLRSGQAGDGGIA